MLKRLLATIVSICMIALPIGCDNRSDDSALGIENNHEHYLWPGYSLEQAVEAADHIVHGIAVQKELDVTYEVSGIDETMTANKVTIEVISMAKEGTTGSSDNAFITYYEIPEGNDGSRTDIPKNLHEGQEVILFLTHHSTVIGPDYVIPVSENTVDPASYLLPDDSNETRSSEDEPLSLETFLALIEDD